METSPSICRAYQWTGFYITGNSVMKELREELVQRHLFSDKFPSLFFTTSIDRDITNIRMNN